MLSGCFCRIKYLEMVLYSFFSGLCGYAGATTGANPPLTPPEPPPEIRVVFCQSLEGENRLRKKGSPVFDRTEISRS